MSVTHRGRPVATPASPGDLPESPAATRVRRHRLQDPRLWLGLLLVAVSVLVGARLFASSDDSVAVWRISEDVAAGDEITMAEVEPVQVRIADDGAAAAYFSADAPLTPGLRAVRPLAAGELLPSAAVIDESVDVPRELPLGVAAAGIPAGLATGDRVEVWAVPPPDVARLPAPVLDDVPVVAISGDEPGGISAERQVLVAVPDSVDLAAVLDGLNGATVVLVRVGSD